MKQIIILLAVVSLSFTHVNAQKIFTKNGTISFFSKTSLEDIKADNNQVMSVLNTQTGEFQFSMLIKSFRFQKALMEEHFNENYMESDEFPKATFKGAITDIKAVNFSKDAVYTVTVNGDLTIHGVTKKASAAGTITISAGKVSAASKFPVKLSDYNISIPKLVKDNIAETIEVTVNCQFDQKM